MINEVVVFERASGVILDGNNFRTLYYESQYCWRCTCTQAYPGIESVAEQKLNEIEPSFVIDTMKHGWQCAMGKDLLLLNIFRS